MTTTLDGFDAGDTATLRLHVVPVGGVPTDSTTTARVELVDPAGQTRNLTALPNADRSDWTATLDELVAGEYVGRWAVTGTGEGVEPLRILVGPSSTSAAGGRSYATTGDLAGYLGAAPPAGARRLLVQATRRVDELLIAAVYRVDQDGMPTDPDVAAALRNATCAQAAWFEETGDEQGSGIAERYSSVRIGNVQLAGPGEGSSSSSSSDGRFAPDAVRILRLAGLLNGHPWVVPL
jgi:hypothetical protein